MADDSISFEPNESPRAERSGRTPDRGLVYRREIALLGLGERVEVVKTPHTVVAYGEDGEPRSIRELLAADRRAWRDRFGAVSADLRDTLESLAPTAELAVSIVYSAPDLLLLRRAAHLAPTQRERREAEAQVSRYLARRRRRILRLLRSVDVVAIAEAQNAPLLGATVRASALSQLASLDEVRVIQHVPGGSGTPAAGPIDPIEHHHISTFYGAEGIYASGQRVGLLDVFLEDDGIRCGIWDEHEAFGFSPPVTYGPTFPPTECTSDAECASVFCNMCRGGKCVLQHSTAVMSVVAASSMTEPRGAAEAEMFIPTVDVCDFSSVMSVFEWFVAKQVHTVLVGQHVVRRRLDRAHGLGSRHVLPVGRLVYVLARHILLAFVLTSCGARTDTAVEDAGTAADVGTIWDECERYGSSEECCADTSCGWYEEHEACYAKSRWCEDDASCMSPRTCQDVRGYAHFPPWRLCEGRWVASSPEVGICQ